jgi:uncharacterized protein YdhG (YjbR/CyaY superfamily)
MSPKTHSINSSLIKFVPKITTMAKGPVAKNVDEYLEPLPADVKAMLTRLRKTIKTALPDAEELISYAIPGYKVNGIPVIYFAAFKDHCSLVPVGKDIVAALGDKLAPYKIKGYTLHFTVDNPLPATLVKEIIKMRLNTNKAVEAARKQKKAAK